MTAIAIEVKCEVKCEVKREVKNEKPLPVGIQILAGANVEAIAVAHAAGLDFIRAEGYAYAHVADEGLIQASAAKLLRYRRMIGAERVQVWADVKKKHSAHAITADVSLGATAETVEFMGADCVIVTGNVTGEAPRPADVKEAKAHCRIPVMLIMRERGITDVLTHDAHFTQEGTHILL